MGEWLSPMTTIQKDQRRRALRRKVSAPSVIRIEFKDGRGNSRHVTADLVDWSAEGMSVILVVPIDPGTVVQVRGKLGAEQRDISCQGTISWCHEVDGRYRMGLGFVDTNEFEHFNTP
jgi:c-di-GMP-binding flagellar brake protein YcgR